MKRRDFPIIRLAPWEYLPGAAPEEIEARAQNVVLFEWGGQQFELAARFADVGDGARYLFLRDISDTGEGNWVFSRGWHDDMPHPFFGGERLGLPGRLDRATQSYKFPFGRLLHFGTEEVGMQKFRRAFVTGSGSGCWLELHVGGGWPREAESFHIPVAPGESLLDWSARDLRTILLEQIACSSSDVRFALDWAQHSELEREDLALRVRRGSVVAMRELLACALKIEPELQKHNALWHWDVEQEEREWSGLNWYEGNSLPEWAPISLRLRAWKQEILAYFGPELDVDLRCRHVCVRKSTGNHEFLLRIELQTPTHHERLEAALWLRDWARGKVAPRKLQLLLSRV